MGGMNFSAEDADRIFRMFFSSDSDGPGLGLGMNRHTIGAAVEIAVRRNTVGYKMITHLTFIADELF